MPHLFLRNIPRYECLLEASRHFPDLNPLAFQAYLHLLRAGDETSRTIMEHLYRHDISPGRFTVLMLLMQKRAGCPDTPAAMGTPAELADMAGCTRATMTGLIDTLERDGYVTRAPDAKDRRMMTVCLTAKGDDLLKDILPGYFQRIAAIMAGLSEAERKTLVKLLTKIQENTGALIPLEKSASGAD